MQYKVWWIPQVPMEPFEVSVDSPEQAAKIMTVLADYDLFQFDKNIKPDYSNAGGLFCREGEDDEWENWEIEEDFGDFFYDDPVVWINDKKQYEEV
jgi:hypothetical protein